MKYSLWSKILHPWLLVASDKMETYILPNRLKHWLLKVHVVMGQPSQDTYCFPPCAPGRVSYLWLKLGFTGEREGNQINYWYLSLSRRFVTWIYGLDEMCHHRFPDVMTGEVCLCAHVGDRIVHARDGFKKLSTKFLKWLCCKFCQEGFSISP